MTLVLATVAEMKCVRVWSGPHVHKSSKHLTIVLSLASMNVVRDLVKEKKEN